jgi:hypothetical protein
MITSLYHSLPGLGTAAGFGAFVRYGDSSLKWIAIARCGPMALLHPGAFYRYQCGETSYKPTYGQSDSLWFSFRIVRYPIGTARLADKNVHKSAT